MKLTSGNILNSIPVWPNDLLILHNRPQWQRLRSPLDVVDPGYGEAVVGTRCCRLNSGSVADPNVQVLVLPADPTGSWAGKCILQFSPIVIPVGDPGLFEVVLNLWPDVLSRAHRHLPALLHLPDQCFNLFISCIYLQLQSKTCSIGIES